MRMASASAIFFLLYFGVEVLFSLGTNDDFCLSSTFTVVLQAAGLVKAVSLFFLGNSFVTVRKVSIKDVIELCKISGGFELLGTG